MDCRKQKITNKTRSLIYGLIKKDQELKSLLGYNIQELKDHLENKFTQDMSWDNYGKWEIDHMLPISSFNYTTTIKKSFLKCWNIKNLQPLWKKDNAEKYASVNGIKKAKAWQYQNKIIFDWRKGMILKDLIKKYKSSPGTITRIIKEKVDEKEFRIEKRRRIRESILKAKNLL